MMSFFIIGPLQVRWQEAVKTLEQKLLGLVGDTLVAATSVAYIGPFTAKYRKDLVLNWVDMCKEAHIPISDQFDLVKNTVDAHQVGYLTLLPLEVATGIL